MFIELNMCGRREADVSYPRVSLLEMMSDANKVNKSPFLATRGGNRPKVSAVQQAGPAG